MRVVKSISDIQKVLNELLDFKARMETQNINLAGRRIINAGASVDPTDYVRKDELQALVTVENTDSQFYTIPFSSTGAINDGDVTAPFISHNGREGYPFLVWVAATQAPASDASFNWQINGNDILAVDLVLPTGSLGVVSSSNFNQPTPKVGNQTRHNPVIRVGGGAALVTVGLVVKVITKSKNG